MAGTTWVFAISLLSLSAVAAEDTKSFTCHPPNDANLAALIQNIEAFTAQLQTHYFEYEASCPPSVRTQISLTMARGFPCLLDLGTPIAEDHLLKMIEKKTIHVSCKNIDPKTVGSHEVPPLASAPLNGNSIELNTYYLTSSTPQKTQGTIFHELFHSIGYGHGRNVEYAYACGVACFGDDLPSRLLAQAICQGDFPSYELQTYKKAIFKFSLETGHAYEHRRKIAFDYLAQSPTDPSALALVGLAYRDLLGGDLIAESFRQQANRLIGQSADREKKELLLQLSTRREALEQPLGKETLFLASAIAHRDCPTLLALAPVKAHVNGDLQQLRAEYYAEVLASTQKSLCSSR
jgi:hypothetical protein